MPDLRLGPLLRYVDDDRVTVWVETDEPCEVAIAGQRQRTFAVEGHHYAILTVHGRTGQPYEVTLDGQRVWPPAGSAFPASRLGIVRGQRTRLVFGSCRTILGDEQDRSDPDTIDALGEYAHRLAAGGGGDPADPPDLLVFLGDQVYDRQGAPVTRAFIRSRRSPDGEPEAEDFEEYTRLYWEAWGDPAVRWLLSTVPSIMIFDDHDIVDNWNTSQAWIEEMRRTPGWRERITAGLMAYWLYQHLGNLDPDALADDGLLQALRAPGDDGRSLREFAAASDAGTYGTPGAQWSFVRDIGDIRVAMVDSRNGRCLEAGQREMLDEDEWAWLEQQARGEVRHLVIGTSVPFLLPRGLHGYESFVDAVGDGAFGRWLVPVAERLRRDLQFNKWAALSCCRATCTTPTSRGWPVRERRSTRSSPPRRATTWSVRSKAGSVPGCRRSALGSETCWRVWPGGHHPRSTGSSPPGRGSATSSPPSSSTGTGSKHAWNGPKPGTRASASPSSPSNSSHQQRRRPPRVDVAGHGSHHSTRTVTPGMGPELIPAAPGTRATSWHRISLDTVYLEPQLGHRVQDVAEIHITANRPSWKSRSHRQ